MTIQIKKLASMASIACIALLAGCINSDFGPSAAQVKEANILADAGTSTLNGVDLSVSALSYSQENLDSLQAANDKFEAAYTTSKGTNSQAAFGSAITGVLLAENSPEVKSQLDQTSILEGSPLDPAQVTNAPLGRIAVLSKAASMAQDPELHQIQDTIQQYFLPALNKAIDRLQHAYNDPNFSVKITIDGKVREIEHPEVGVLLAGFKAVHALVTLFLSYDLDFDHNGSYDYLDTIGNSDLGSVSTMSQAEKDSLHILTQLLSPGSSFLAVRSGWKSALAGVDDEIVASLGIVKSSISSLQSEAGDTNVGMDLMHLCSKSTETPCIEDADFSKALDGIDTVTRYMTQTVSVPVMDTVIRVNLAAYFNIQDYKKQFPYYNFYSEALWSDAKPVLYFTNSSGTETGNLKTVGDILNNYDDYLLTSAQTVTQLKAQIHLQDPTFQGLLPGATEANIWNLIQKDMDQNQSSNILAKRGVKIKPSSFVRPEFALSLLKGAH